MSGDNLRHWSALERTDPTATKPFKRAGGFAGTATKPIYHTKKMTETFGPCGIGWGMSKPEFQLVSAGSETLVFCTVALWYMDGEQRGEVFGVGGDKVIAQQRTGPFVSDEAFKAAFTDALGNAMKHIGVGADVHMGEFDKYGRDRDDAPAPRERSATPPPPHADNGTTAPAATARPVPPPNPEEPPEVADQRRAARAHFWNRDTYGIDPAVIQGGIGAWDREMLAHAEAAPTLDAFLKLRDENEKFFMTWARQVRAPVVESFNARMDAAYQRVARLEGVAA